MSNWTAYLIAHLIGFVIFTLPVMWLLATFVFNTPFAPMIPWIAVGSAIMVFILGVSKYGLP